MRRLLALARESHAEDGEERIGRTRRETEGNAEHIPAVAVLFGNYCGGLTGNKYEDT